MPLMNGAMEIHCRENLSDYITGRRFHANPNLLICSRGLYLGEGLGYFTQLSIFD